MLPNRVYKTFILFEAARSSPYRPKEEEQPEGTTITHKEQILEKVHTLPLLSPVVMKLREAILDPAVSVNEIVSLLQCDPVLSAKVLRLANSAYIGLPKSVSSLLNAVVLLGFQRVYAIALISSILSGGQVAGSRQFDIQRFWKHSVAVALIAESIAVRQMRYDYLESSDLFCAGLLHDIGKMILAMFASQSYDTACEQALLQKKPLYLVEQPQINHAAVAGAVAAQWNFPDNLCQALLLHHTVQAVTQYQKQVALVHIADHLAHTIALSCIVQETRPELIPLSLTFLRLEPEHLAVIAAEANEKQNNLQQLFDSL